MKQAVQIILIGTNVYVVLLQAYNWFDYTGTNYSNLAMDTVAIVNNYNFIWKQWIEGVYGMLSET